METTRDEILVYLKTHRSATARELSLAFGQTQANIRYHLSRLEKENLIEPFQQPASRKINLRGRPTLHYRLAKIGKPDDIDRLAGLLLDTLGPENSETFLAVANKLLDSVPPSLHIPTRLNSIVDCLNQHAYHARWEARSSGPVMILGNCPYARILAQHPELCEIDRVALESASQMKTTQVSRFDQATTPPFACQFRLSPPEKSK